MKKQLLLAVGLLGSIAAFAQAGTTVDYEDQFGPLTMVYDGLFNGKHAYTATEATFRGDLRYNSGNNRWELLGSDAGGPPYVIIYSTMVTPMNPPNLTDGNYQVVTPAITVTKLEGSGTFTAAMPVALTAFGATVERARVRLHWQTARELNNTGFEVQRSADGQRYEKLTFVPGHGTTATAQTYRYEDVPPASGHYYYRLRQIDTDGTVDYSPVVTARLASTVNPPLLSPNPTSGDAQLDLTFPTPTPLQLDLYNAAGQSLQTVHYDLAAGRHRLPLALGHLVPGVYTLAVTQGRERTYQRVVVE